MPQWVTFRDRIWLPLVDALRTLLLVPAPEVVETLERFRFSTSLRAGPATIS